MKRTITPPFRLSALFALTVLTACGGGGDPAVTSGTTTLLAMSAAVQPMAAPVAGSYSWTLADPTRRIWHSMSANPTGDVIVAGEAGGQMHVSRDGGATWVAGNSPTGSTWISSAMSASGDRIYAQQYGGAMYLSRDYGASWSALTNAGTGTGWEAVTSSQDGMHVAAVVQNGPVLVSSDGGASWRTPAMPDGQPNHWWRWIYSSSDGRLAVIDTRTGHAIELTPLTRKLPHRSAGEQVYAGWRSEFPP